jgi:hypothetical protein
MAVSRNGNSDDRLERTSVRTGAGASGGSETRQSRNGSGCECGVSPNRTRVRYQWTCNPWVARSRGTHTAALTRWNHRTHGTSRGMATHGRSVGARPLIRDVRPMASHTHAGIDCQHPYVTKSGSAPTNHNVQKRGSRMRVCARLLFVCMSQGASGGSDC